MTPAESPTILITGAAGFIGSHLTDKLLSLRHNVVGFDNLSAGSKTNLKNAMKDSRFRFVKGDLLHRNETQHALGDCSLIFHLAADPEVRVGEENPEKHFRQNLVATYNLLDAIRRRRTSTRVVFASTSTVYGEATVIPTPEDYGPLLPISTYGATKLGCEALAASFTQLAPLSVAIFRFANVVGDRSRHGVVYDFIAKLKKNPKQLEILGDGTQSKSYLHVDDYVSAFLMPLKESFWRNPVEVLNIGSEDQINVLRLAKVVTETMRLKDVAFRTTQPPGGIAWPGDVKVMQLDASRIKKLGWQCKRNSEEALRLAAEELIDSMHS
jgi:UDP-glucose 4-epimerase